MWEAVKNKFFFKDSKKENQFLKFDKKNLLTQ